MGRGGTIYIHFFLSGSKSSVTLGMNQVAASNLVFALPQEHGSQHTLTLRLTQGAQGIGIASDSYTRRPSNNNKNLNHNTQR